MNKKIIIFLLATILLLIFIVTSDLGHIFTVDNLLENKDQLVKVTQEHFLVSMFTYVLSYVVLVAIGLPVFIVYALAAGLMFGFFMGNILTMGAAFIGAVITFLTTRHILYDYFRNKYGHRLAHMEKRLEDKELKVMLGLRLFPGMPYSIITVMTALSPMKLQNFMLGTFLGNMPKKLLLVYMGFVLRRVDDLSEISTPNLWLPLLGLVLIIVISFIKRHKKANLH
jgi:uncharacterized membrane protein YdjX (TVP38/TMEM64 family)